MGPRPPPTENPGSGPENNIDFIMNATNSQLNYHNSDAHEFVHTPPYLGTCEYYTELKNEYTIFFRFILLHIAFILNVIALATPYWVYAPTYNHSIPHNETMNETTKGMWKICKEGDCEYFDTPQPSTWKSD